MTHAMVITAYHRRRSFGVDEKESTEQKGDASRAVTKWRVENSWSDKRGDRGYYMMTDAWFDEYVYQIVVDNSVIPKRALDALSQRPVVLPPWDPMGSLAQ